MVGLSVVARACLGLCFCFVFGTGCGPFVVVEDDQDPRYGSGIDPAFQSQVLEFERLWGHQVYDIPITFGKFTPADGDTVGVCITYDTSGHGARWWAREIFIHERAWLWLDDVSREILIFHELGHCALGLDHSRGIMAPYLMDTDSYLERREEYVNLLFRSQLKK